MGHIHQTSKFTNIQNAFVMLNDWVNRNVHNADSKNKIYYNLGFYITEPLETSMDVAWYSTAQSVSAVPTIDTLNAVLTKREYKTPKFTVKLVVLKHGCGLAIHIHEMDLWYEFEKYHFYFSTLLKRVSNTKQVQSEWIHYSITELKLPTEHCEAQTEYYKNNPLENE